MTKSIEALKDKINNDIFNIIDLMNEINETFKTRNGEGENKAIIEKIDAYRERFEMIEKKMKEVNEENEMNNIKEEIDRIEEEVKKDKEMIDKTNNNKEEYLERKEKWEINNDIMMITGKYFEECRLCQFDENDQEISRNSSNVSFQSNQ